MRLFGLVTFGAFVGQLLGATLAGADAQSLLTSDLSSARKPLLILQAFTASSAFIAAPLLYLHLFAPPDDRGGLFRWRRGYTLPLLLALGLTLAFMAVNTWFIQWNMSIQLPAGLRAFEAWAREQEAARRRIVVFLTTFHSTKALMIGLLVMGIIPAVGEELLFRGLVQPLCQQITRNPHSAIIVSALSFSAIHLQFYGFVPRFLLGALFGYLYWWTKDLTFPMAAHFLNNAVTLLLLFLHQRGIITQDIAQPTALPPAVLLFAALLVGILSHHLKQLSKQHAP